MARRPVSLKQPSGLTVQAKEYIVMVSKHSGSRSAGVRVFKELKNNEVS